MADVDYSRIVKQAWVSYLGTFITFLFTPLLTFILTRTLSLREYGVYSLISVTIVIATVLLDIGFSQYVITVFPGKTEKERRKMLWSILWFQVYLSAAALACVGLLMCTSSLPELFRISDVKIEFLIGFAIVILSLPLGLLLAHYNAKKEIEFATAISVLKNCLFVAFIAVFFAATKTINLFWTMFLWMLGTLLSLAICFLRDKRLIGSANRNRFDGAQVRIALVFGVPLLFYSMGSYVMALGDRYILGYYRGADAVALYSLAYALIGFVIGMGAVALSVMLPHFSEKWNLRKGALRLSEPYNVLLNVTFKYVLLITIPLSIGLFAMREQIITMISGVKYAAAASVIPFLIIIPVATSLMNVFYRIMLLAKKTALVAWVFLAAALLSIVANFLVIPRYGMFGASLVNSVMYLGVTVVLYLLCRKWFVFNNTYVRVERIIASAAVMGIIVFLIHPETVWTKIATILLGGVVYGGMLFLTNTFVMHEIQTVRSYVRGVSRLDILRRKFFK